MCVPQSPLVDLWKQISGCPWGVFESVDLEWGLIICILNKYLGDGDAAGPKTKLWKSHYFKEMNRSTWELSYLLYLRDPFFFFLLWRHWISLMWMRFLPHEKLTNTWLDVFHKTMAGTHLTPGKLPRVPSSHLLRDLPCFKTIVFYRPPSKIWWVPKANFIGVFGLSNFFASLHFMLLPIPMNAESH